MGVGQLARELHVWSVLGILCVSKGGLFLSFVVSNSDSALWLGGGLVLIWSFWECHGGSPLGPPSTRGVSFLYDDGVMSSEVCL